MAPPRFIGLLLDRLLPPPWREDDEYRRRGHLLNGIALGIILGALTMVAVRGSAVGYSHPIVLIAYFVAATHLTVPLLLRWARSLVAGGIVVFGVPTVALIAEMFAESGLHSNSVLWMPLMPLVATIFLGPRGAVACSFTFSVGILVATYFHISGAWSPFAGLLPVRAFTAVAGVWISTFLGWLWERTRRQAQVNLAHSEARARALLDSLPDTLLRVNGAGQIVDVHLPHDIASLVPADANHHRLKDIFPQKLAHELRQHTLKTLLEQTMTRANYRITSPVDHRDLTVEISMAPLDEDVIMLMRDVSDLQQANRLKDEFLSTVSHELRTPLTSIIGSLRLMESEVTGKCDGESHTLLGIATRNSERLLRLINDLLDMQKIAGGRLELVPHRTELGEILAANIAADLPFAKLHQIDLRLESPAEKTWVEVDPDRLSQVISNLISNAVKHSPPGEVVCLRAKRQNDNVRIEVEDHGPGIPEEFQPFVFERFSQAIGHKQTNNNQRLPSTGLGLAIARQLVELQGGTISFTTTSGEGTTFFVDLPTSH